MTATHQLFHTNDMTFFFLITVALALTTPCLAGDNGKKVPRTMNYYPDQGQIVCVNGSNRYTRALYGSNTRQRLETSDRPVFASYDRDNSLNICFLIESNGRLQPLDSTSFCEARYEGGQRSYTLSVAVSPAGVVTTRYAARCPTARLSAGVSYLQERRVGTPGGSHVAVGLWHSECHHT